MSVAQVKRILNRILATVVLKVSGILAGGSVADYVLNGGDVDVIKNAAIAALVGIWEVAEALSKAYVGDGVITRAEEDAAFNAQLNKGE